jgi:hypothetical protein
MMKKPFSKTGIADIPADKPILYTLENASGTTNYVGVAKRGRVRERLQEHLPGGPNPIPAKTVKISQFSSIEEAKAAEQRAVRAKGPKYNKNK